MRTIGAEEQQIIEAEAVQAGIPTLLLMEQAARAVADLTLKLLSSGDYLSVSILCGAGNNGGDGYAAARFTAWIVYPICACMNQPPLLTIRGMLASTGKLA
jgi:Uncharacterized conserved protein